MRSNYWSCTKFADWIRGTAKLGMGTADEWEDWRTSAKMRHNFRYWLAEEGLDYLQNFVMWPIDKLYAVKYYINNRWVTRTHALTASPSDIPRGEWRDVGYRFLPCLFNELVDFVEIELAWHHIAWDNEARLKYQPPFWARGWFRWRTWRNAEAGLDNLRWQMDLVLNDSYGVAESDPKYGQPTHQAVAAKEIYDLYTWWTYERPKRPDPHDASGWTEYCELKRKHAESKGVSDSFSGLFSDRLDTKELKKMSRRALKLCSQIENKYEREDEAMMIRLIKVRQSLWT